MKLSTTAGFLFLITLVSINGFQTKLIPVNTMQIINFAASLVMLAISLPYFFRKGVGFILPVQLICIAMIISMFMAYTYWDQSFLTSLKSTIPAMQWVFFFYLYHKKVPVKMIEDIVLIYGVLYIALFLYQFTHSGTVYFGWQEEFVEDRGIVRVNFPGTGIFFLSNFIALNRFTKEKSNRMFMGAFVLAGFAVMVLQVTRQYIAILLFIYLFHFIRNINIIKKVIVMSLFGIAIYIALISDNPISKGLLEEQKKTASEKSEYVRIRAGEYFLTDISPSFMPRIFGNGVPYAEESELSRTIKYKESVGYYLTDVGIIAVYAMFGLIAVVGFLMIFVKSFTLKLPPRYQYLKYYLWMLLFTCLTSDSVYGDKCLITNIFVLYCFQALYEKSLVGENVNETEQTTDLQYSAYG